VACVVRGGCLLLETRYECVEEFHGSVAPFAAGNMRVTAESRIIIDGHTLFAPLQSHPLSFLQNRFGLFLLSPLG
jgi:hypothetical protein